MVLSTVKISELIHNSKEPCFYSKIEIKRRLRKIVINTWYTKRNLYSQVKLELYSTLATRNFNKQKGSIDKKLLSRLVDFGRLGRRGLE